MSLLIRSSSGGVTVVRTAPSLQAPILNQFQGERSYAFVEESVIAEGYEWLGFYTFTGLHWIAYKRPESATRRIHIQGGVNSVVLSSALPTLARFQLGEFPHYTADSLALLSLRSLEGQALKWDDEKGFGFAREPKTLFWAELLYGNRTSITPLYLLFKMSLRPPSKYYVFVTKDTRFTANGDPHITQGGYEVAGGAVDRIIKAFYKAQGA